MNVRPGKICSYYFAELWCTLFCILHYVRYIYDIPSVTLYKQNYHMGNMVSSTSTGNINQEANCNTVGEGKFLDNLTFRQ